MTTFLIALVLVLLCAAGIGIKTLITGQSFSCRRCGNPEKKNCNVCKKKRPPSS